MGRAMPPTRGHDLKHLVNVDRKPQFLRMPPTRGHDLKRLPDKSCITDHPDAPHTGARLETFSGAAPGISICDAPHTGARLETGGI